ncbi:MAG TPA: SRPBCC family protein [Candidatus Dormibacteraeota bacterium]
MGGVNREPGPPPVEVSVDVAAPAEAVYALVSDVRRMGEWSPECVRCEWMGGAGGAAVGARFRGHNRIGLRRWSTVSTVVSADPGRSFAFRVASMGLPVAEWRYTVTAIPGGCRISETWTDSRGGVIRALGRVATGVGDRAAHNRRGMEATLARIKAAAEGGAR